MILRQPGRNRPTMVCVAVVVGAILLACGTRSLAAAPGETIAATARKVVALLIARVSLSMRFCWPGSVPAASNALASSRFFLASARLTSG